MNSFWRMLETWTTYQDHVWFLALLAWSSVIAAEFRTRRVEVGTITWRTVFAGCCMAGILVEFALLVQDLHTPYTKLDLAMGLAQAAGTGVLLWAVTAQIQRRRLWLSLGGTLLAALASLRGQWPIEAGLGLALVQALTVLAMVRVTPGALPGPVALLLTVSPLFATFGPWAYAINHGRRNVDWSHFALLSACTLGAAGAWLGAVEWRRRLDELGPERLSDRRLRRDIAMALVGLGAWLACGMALAVWVGRQTRQTYEQYLLRRVEMEAQLLSPALVAKVLGPDLKITRIEHRRYPNGLPVDVAWTPSTNSPQYAELTSQMREWRRRNSDFVLADLAAIRSGEVVLFSESPRPITDVTHSIYHHAEQRDFDRAGSRASSIEGPQRSPFGSQVAVYVPLFAPESQEFLGWFLAQVNSTKWAANQMLARLQTMGLVGVGVGLWSLALAYRLRREARDAAERKAHDSEAADRLKSAFLAKVSHELRTPIQSVLGYGELLANAGLTEPHAAWVAALRSHGTIMLRLVNDLIDMGALQSGAFRLELGAVNLRAVVDECIVSLSPAAAEKNLVLQMRVAPDVPAWVRTDGVRLRQILLNLLKNAVKFTPAGHVQLTVHRQQGEIEFIVADTGPGIPADLRDQLFKPFARLTPNASVGSGLGLALVHGLAQAMGGEVFHDESSTTGATFVARLPLAPCPPPTVAPEPAASAVALAGMTLLVAEDNTLVAELLRTFLTSHGAKVLAAADGITAENAARNHQPDALLLDIGLPGRDGIAIAESLRRDGPRGLRIIGLSAHAGPNEEAAARAAGMDDFLTKPVNLAHLAHVLQRKRANGPIAMPRIEDPKLRALLAAQFAQETPQVLQQLQEAAAARNWQEVRTRAHYLKNSADVIGAADLQAACRQVMQIDTSPDPAVVRRLIETVLAAVPGSAFESPAKR